MKVVLKRLGNKLINIGQTLRTDASSTVRWESGRVLILFGNVFIHQIK